MNPNEKVLLFFGAVALLFLVMSRQKIPSITIPIYVPDYTGYNATPPLTPQMTRPIRTVVGGEQ